MNNSKRTLASVTAMVALSGLGLSACGSSDNSASKAPGVNSSLSATQSASKTAPTPSSTSAEKKVSRDEHRSPVASPTSSTSTKAPATEKAETPKATATPSVTQAPVTHRATSAPKKVVNTAPKHVVTSKSWSNTQTLAQPQAVYVKDSSMAKGKTRVISQGHPGKATVSYKRTLVNGVPGAAKVVSSDVVTSPKATRIAVGSYVAPKKAVKPTYVAPKATKRATVQATPKKAAVATRSTASPAMNRQGMWEKIAQCESTGNWSIASGNGYYGGLQFNHQAWVDAGGLKYGYNANMATKAQQIEIANNLYASRGLQPWQCGWAASR